MSVLSRWESEAGSFVASRESEGDDRRGVGVAWIERKGAMRSAPVRVRVSDGVALEMRAARGRMGRETRGIIVRKKGKRGSNRLIMTVVEGRQFLVCGLDRA